MSNEAFRGYPKPERLMHYIEDYLAFHHDNPKKLGGKIPASQKRVVRDCVAQVSRLRGIELRDVELLDYGSGKGYQYLRDRMHMEWGGALPWCYDPGVMQLGQRPDKQFHGVFCLDVMEHIEPEDLSDVIRDCVQYVDGQPGSFVYFHTCCRMASKHFPDGRNLHRTVMPSDWWEAEQYGPFRKEFPQVNIVTTYEGAPEETMLPVPTRE